jgi:hypothetical protein
VKQSIRTLAILLTSTLFAQTVEAGECLDPHFSYEAHALDAHALLAKNTIGSHRTELVLTTSCIDLKVAYHFTLASTFTCIGQGDTVTATTIDGQHEICRVTRVAPYKTPPAP